VEDRLNRDLRELEAVLKWDGLGTEDVETVGRGTGRGTGTAVGGMAGDIASILAIMGLIMGGDM
jgi:hypothetical protein